MPSLDDLITRAKQIEADFIAAMNQVPPNSLKAKRMAQRLQKSKSIIASLIEAKHAAGTPPIFTQLMKGILDCHEKVCRVIKEAPIDTYE